MATTQYPGLRSTAIIVPLSTVLLNTLGLTGGLYGFLAPGAEPAKLFGIHPPTPLDSNSEADARQRAYIQIHSIRNLAVGLSGLGLLAFWRFSNTCQSSSLAANAVQKAIAITMGVGSLVGLADGSILAKFGQTQQLSGEARALANEKKTGHMIIAIPILALAFGWWYM